MPGTVVALSQYFRCGIVATAIILGHPLSRPGARLRGAAPSFAYPSCVCVNDRRLIEFLNQGTDEHIVRGARLRPNLNGPDQTQTR